MESKSGDLITYLNRADLTRRTVARMTAECRSETYNPIIRMRIIDPEPSFIHFFCRSVTNPASAST